MENITHVNLDCGIELAVLPLTDRNVVSAEFRVLAGSVDEPAEKLGLGRLVKETIDKGTQQRDGRALSDAFDEIGASVGNWIGRESTGYHFLCLPQYVAQAVSLHAEFLQTPTFPEEMVQTAITLSDQEISALEDDPPSLADKLIDRQAFGPILGRHALGERQSLANIARPDLVDYWRKHYGCGRMQVSMAGNIDPDDAAALLEREFAGFGAADQSGRSGAAFTFEPGQSHLDRQIEQEQICIAFPSAAATDDDYPAERVMLGILSGGMSGRLFTEVREKQGLAYDVHAGADNPRDLGMIFVTASCKPDRSETTFTTLLRELDRLSHDVTAAELDRSKRRLIARDETMIDITRSRRRVLGSNLFHYGRPIPLAERIEQIQAVTVDNVQQYLRSHPRDRLSIVTVGPVTL